MEFDPAYKEPHVRTADWLITILITNIPINGLIMLVVWALDKDTNLSKSNWAKAKLIWYAIAIGIVVLFLFVVGFGAFVGNFNNFDFTEF